MGIRLKTKKLIYAGLIGAVIAFLIATVIVYLLYGREKDRQANVIEKYKEEIASMRAIAETNNSVLSLVTDIEKGTIITPELIETVYVPSGATAEDTIEQADLKLNDKFVLFAKTDLKANTVLTSSLLYKEENITNDIREAEYGFIELPTNVKKDSYVDVRIQFPTGDEFIVLSKKRMKNVEGITAWMNLGEDELLTISSAIVDAYIEGAKIYAIPYVDEHMQTKSIQTYPVKANVRELIETSPNILNVAEIYLTNQNRERLEENLSKLPIDKRNQVETGQKDTRIQVDNANQRLSEERRLQQMNEEAEAQQNLLGGSSE